MLSVKKKSVLNWELGLSYRRPVMLPAGVSRSLSFGVLTYMSIRDLINTHLGGPDPGLSLMRLSIAGDPVVRTIFLSKDLRVLLDGPWGDRSTERRVGRLRADLESFIKGEQIGLCLRPFEAGPAYMGLLDPPADGQFDIRSRDPQPGLRVFGGFPETDVFVALTWAARQPLGVRGSREWRDECVRCKVAWRNLLHPYTPKTGTDIHDFISRNVFLVGGRPGTANPSC